MSEWYSKVTPLTDWEVYNKEGNQYIYYEELNLHGFVAVGDSVCNFNPVYGQGVTTAAESILLLDYIIRKEPYKRGFCKHFQSKLSSQLMCPWLLSVISDLRFKNTQSDNKMMKMFIPLADKLFVRWLTACVKNKLAVKTFWNFVMAKEGYIWAMLNPVVLWAILTG